MAGPLISLAGVRREFPAGEQTIAVLKAVSYTHLTLPTKRIG